MHAHGECQYEYRCMVPLAPLGEYLKSLKSCYRPLGSSSWCSHINFREYRAIIYCFVALGESYSSAKKHGYAGAGGRIPMHNR